MVLQAGDRDSPFREAALAELLQSYWYPLYGYIRRQGYDANTAEDLLQAFLASVLERDSFRGVQQGQGRFRNFLLVCLRNFLASEVERAKALKRGGNLRIGSLDFATADARYSLEPSHNVTAERLFERDWAQGIIEQTFTSLADDWARSGKERQFQTLSRYLIAAEPAQSYAAAAAELRTTEGAVKTAVHRLRAQFRELLCQQVIATIGNDDLLEDEIRHLFSALSL
jgi:RNA polymerase sigma-70 factor (ECF subfamily)